jgi:murein L,D-transpeptidase YcbB/YkuD
MRNRARLSALGCVLAAAMFGGAAVAQAIQAAPSSSSSSALVTPKIPGDPVARLIQQRLAGDGETSRVTTTSTDVGWGSIDPDVAEADFYARRRDLPAWSDAENTRQLLASLRAMALDGLDPGDYHVEELAKAAASMQASSASPAQRADFDLAATHAYITALLQLRRGKVNPGLLDKQWNFNPATSDPTHALAPIIDLVNTHRVAQAFAQARPQNVIYEKLRTGLAELRAVEKSGGWPIIPAGAPLKPDAVDPRVASLRGRLMAAGYLDHSSSGLSTEDAYDDALQAAVKRFQTEQYLPADGIVGNATLAVLNVPLAARIDQVRVNLERARWLLHALHGTFVVVDIAGYKVSYYRDGQRLWRSRVQVGKPFRSTPIFQAQISYITFNPTWTVPPTILVKDILPKVRKNPGYLAAHRIRVLNAKGEVIAASSVDWSAPRGITLRQDAGPDNSLGRVVIRFPNPYAVYLHDTPHKNLFSSDQRATSSGCIRVENPLQLVQLLFNDPVKWSAAAIDAKLQTTTTENVSLPTRVPLLLAYWTVDLTDDGRVTFKSDVYGRDAALLRALDSPLPTLPDRYIR